MSDLIIILGDRGTGKTLYLTRIALTSKYPFYANYKIYGDKKKTKLHSKYNELFPEEILMMDATPKRILITEAYEYFESRLGMGSFQRYMSYTVFQSRKRYIDFVIDTQLENTIDQRFLKLCDYVILSDIEDWGFHYYISDKRNIREFGITFKEAEKFWDFYDSWEISLTPQVQKLGVEIGLNNKSKVKEMLKKLEKRFWEEYPNIEEKRITHPVIESFLLDIDGEKEFGTNLDCYETYLYAHIKKTALQKEL